MLAAELNPSALPRLPSYRVDADAAGASDPP